MDSWQFLIGVSVLVNSISVLLQKVLLKVDKNDPISFSIFFQLGVAVVIGLLVQVFEGNLDLPVISTQIFWSLLIMAILYAGGNIFVFKSLKLAEASSFTVIFSSKTIFAVLGSILLFDERLSFINSVGIVLILLGVVIVSLKKLKINFSKGEVFAFMAAIAFGFANTNDKFLINFFNPFTYVVIGFFLPGITIMALYPNKIKLIGSYFKKSVLWKMVVLCTLYGFSAITFFAALQKAPNSSLVFAVNAFSGVLTVILAVFFLKERSFLPRKIVGSILSLIGLLLVNI